MRWKTMMLLALTVLVPVSMAYAQEAKVEVTPFIGYTASEGVSIDPVTFQGVVYNGVSPKSGLSYGFAVDVFVTPNMEVGFQFGRQDSALVANGSAGDRDLTDMAIYNYHGIFTYNWGDPRYKARPYVFGGIGATQYSPDDVMGTSIQGETKFSTTWGGGVKFVANEHIGVRAGVRWTPTYIKSDPAGVWCSPYWPWGCYVLSDTQYSNQFEFQAGVVFRF